MSFIMIQEYLFTDGTHKAEFEKYEHKPVNIEICDIENSDCWIAKCSIDGDNKESANILSVVHEYVMDNYRPTVLSNGCAAYYNKFLYPYFNEFERKLRKLLYLKSALSEDKRDSETIKDLESKDLGAIFALLFADPLFNQDVRERVKKIKGQFTKSEILDILQGISENTLWDKLLGEKAVPELRSDFVKVKEFRNDVMHAHNMSASSFSEALKLIKKINEQLDAEIRKNIINKDAAQDGQNGETFSAAISNAIKKMNEVSQEAKLQEKVAMIETAVALSEGCDIIAAYMEQHKVTLASAILEIQENMLEIQEKLQAFTPNPAITESANKIKEFLENKHHAQTEI